MTQTYNADAIEVPRVLSWFAAARGCTPIRRAQTIWAVIDNSVDEALAGHAKRVDVILHADQSLEVIDDGRGMPVDIHRKRACLPLS